MLRMFDFKCQSCGLVEEKIVDVSEVVQKCPECPSGTMLRQLPIFSVNMGAAGAHGKWDDTLQKFIHTNKQHKEEMRKQGVTIKGETPKPDGQAWV